MLKRLKLSLSMSIALHTYVVEQR